MVECEPNPNLPKRAGAARRTREYREREKEAAASDAHERHAAVTAKLQRETERRQSQRQPQAEASRLERQQTREQRANDIENAKQLLKQRKHEQAQIRKALKETPKCLLDPNDALRLGPKALRRAPRAADCRGLQPCSVAVAAGVPCPKFDACQPLGHWMPASFAVLCAQQQLKDARERLLRQPEDAGEQEHLWHCSVAGEGCIKPSEDSPGPTEACNVFVCNACERPRRQWGFCVCHVCEPGWVAGKHGMHPKMWKAYCPNHYDEYWEQGMAARAPPYSQSLQRSDCERPVFPRNDPRNKFEW